MDEPTSIEERRDFNVANLRWAFGAPIPADPSSPFGDLLRRMAVREALLPEAGPGGARPRARTET